ncbi:MAG: hypothetical protein WC969_15000 [Elusimicrobiota bacterium]
MSDAELAVARLRADPFLFFREVLGLGLITPDQTRVVESVRDNRRTAAPAGHGVGKTLIAAALALQFLLTRFGSKVITTAPTWFQVEMLLWREINRLHGGARISLGGNLSSTRLDLGPEWFAVGLSTDEPTRFQGVHAPAVMVIFDEATGVDPGIWDAAEGIAVSPGDRFLALGNPTDPSARFKTVCDSGDWNVVEISSENHPNVLERRSVIPGAATYEWVQERLKKYGGRDSDEYRFRVLGKWPKAGSNVLISTALVEEAAARWVEPSGRPDAAGCDVARYGSDETVIVPIHEGGHPALPEFRQGQNTMETAGQLKNLNARRTHVDDTGVGGGVTDRLAEQEFPVQGENFGENARDEERYVNRRTELWCGTRDALRTGLVSVPPDPVLVADLTSVRYSFDSKGRFRLESKDEIKKRLKRSPDRGDAYVLGVAAYIDQNHRLDLDIPPSTEWAEYGQGATF